MSNQIIGKVLNKATADSFYFASTKYFKSRFVEVTADHIHQGAKLIGEIIEKEAINQFLEKPEGIRFLSQDDENVTIKNLYVAKVKAIALLLDGKQEEVTFPPLPGSNVYEAELADLAQALELNSSGIDIGQLKGYDLPLRISGDKLLRTHISILGQTGSGKSYLAAKLAIEMTKGRSDTHKPFQAIYPIIFDSSGEFSGTYEDSEYWQLSRIMDVRKIGEQHFPLLNNKYLPLLYYIYNIDEKQESSLRIFIDLISNANIAEHDANNDQISLLKETSAKALLDEFSKLKILSTNQLASSLEKYIRKINDLKTNIRIPMPYKSISKMKNINLNIKKTDDIEIIKKGTRGLILDLSSLDNYEERQITLLLYLRQIYELARAGKLSARLVLFIDEAHNYVPSIYSSYCKEEILRLAREGRKYHITLCLISQRPRWVDPTALSQCGNIFIFRIQNSDDQKHIFDSASLPDTIRELSLAKMKTGEMIVTGDVVNMPLACTVSKLDTQYIENIVSKAKDTASAIVRPQDKLL